MADAPLRRLITGLLLVVASLAAITGPGSAQEATPAAGEPVVAHHPAHLHRGSCAQPDPDPAYKLTEIAMDMGTMGEGTAIPVEISTTTVDVTLSGLLAVPYAIDVHEVRELDQQGTVVACGDTAGQPSGDSLAVGVREANDSELAGIAVLQATGEQTTVTLYLAHGLSGTMDDRMTSEVSIATVAFHVPTITCPGCQGRVEANVTNAPGILAIAFSGQDVTVTYDPSQVSPEEIQAAIETGGDTVEPLGM